MSDPRASCGDVWMVDFGKPRGHEQAGRRPGLIVSNDFMNHGPSRLVIAVPISTKFKGVPTHVSVSPPEGVVEPSFIRCEDIRSISTERLLHRMGEVEPSTMEAVHESLRILLNIR
jgi:mRNA interferase MazF